MNKRMYQRWVYFEVQELIPECILMLKDILDADQYSAMAHRLIRFDEDMSSIALSWIEVWSHLLNYYLEHQSQRFRISCLEKMMQTIRALKFTMYGKRMVTIPMDKWAQLEDREEAWLQMIDYLKKVWDEKDDTRLTREVIYDTCSKCEFELASHYM